MKRTFEHIAIWKKVDIVFQCIVFIAMIFVTIYSSLSLFGMYLMGLAQFLSSIIWEITLDNDVPKVKGGNGLRWAIIIISIVLAVTLAFNGMLFMLISILMIGIGPILGIMYFIQTLNECKYYSNARKPYYLL